MNNFRHCKTCGRREDDPIQTNPYAEGFHRWRIGPYHGEPFSDRYDAARPEEEHDGGLGSGDWMGPWEDR